MKISFYIIIIILLLGGTSILTLLDNKEGEQKQILLSEVNQIPKSINSGNLLTASDAEKILGQMVHLTDSSSLDKVGISQYLCSYTADFKDLKTGKTGAVYFLYEQFAEIASAKNKYKTIKTANENHEGIKILNDLGDEAYFHSDGVNFYFIMVRKGDKVFNIKVNKITSNTSLDMFNLIAKKITSSL
jgi:hypothetical protein